MDERHMTLARLPKIMLRGPRLGKPACHRHQGTARVRASIASRQAHRIGHPLRSANRLCPL
jgi:hypothetical protein